MAVDPSTRAEWQEAADCANVMLKVDGAMQYGLITGPKVNVDRCLEILHRASAMGIQPDEGETTLHRHLAPFLAPKKGTVNHG